MSDAPSAIQHDQSFAERLHDCFSLLAVGLGPQEPRPALEHDRRL